MVVNFRFVHRVVVEESTNVKEEFNKEVSLLQLKVGLACNVNTRFYQCIM